ncbi:MAG TPA: DUF2950 domain-containing protein [Verrucomicrobiae bacterium]|nr:DUF2950 domain-containing protein [Verrucomicrobiae bacterium]
MKLRTLFWMDHRSMAVGIAVVLALPTCLMAADEQRFDSPEAAVAALTNAATAKDTNAIRDIFGPEGHALVSPDAVQANENFNHFVTRVTEKTRLVPMGEGRDELEIGSEGWPFPIPLVKEDAKWYFDVAAGREEILNRRIGSDELGAMNVCHAYVDAQREYASRDHSGNDVLQYAQNLRSTPGKHDGLYWPVTNDNEQLSPLGPLITEAREEGYHRHTGMMTDQNTQTPYHGYYYKILTRQGSHAPGGKYDYIINGNMIAGFALVAWPAEWNNTGVMTFIVNQQGKIYQKNLGPKTDAIAKHMTAYDPDPSWTLVGTLQNASR